MRLEGRARILGHDVNTDYIVASSRKKENPDPEFLKRYLLEAVDPTFADSVRPGDLLVAGRNLGCGSAMEVAAAVIVAAGIRAVVAQSFSRTFFRNAVNNGLLPIEADTGEIREGDRLEIEAGDPSRVWNRTQDREHVGGRLPEVVLGILREGGLVPYFRRRGGFADGPIR